MRGQFYMALTIFTYLWGRAVWVSEYQSRFVNIDQVELNTKNIG